MDEHPPPPLACRRLAALCVVAGVLALAAAMPGTRSSMRDAMALARIAATVPASPGERVPTTSTFADSPATFSPRALAESEQPPDPYAGLRASGHALRVLRSARSQLGMPYVYGATPRHQWSLARLDDRPLRTGWDCSQFVAWAMLHGAGTWISGNIAHTDEIWTQGGRLPLDATPARTNVIVRGIGTKPPPGGYRPGDLLLLRSEGAGGVWGHVVMVSERGLVIEAFPPDVHETRTIKELLEQEPQLGWLRLRQLPA